MRLFDPQPYRCEELELTIVQVGEVQDPLCVFFRKYEKYSLESLQANKYQDGAGLRTVARL